VLILPMLFGAFRPPKPAPGGPATVFPWGRVMQHKQGTLEGFTAAYGCKRLLYFEGYEDILTAIAREKQLKGWRRFRGSFEEKHPKQVALIGRSPGLSSAIPVRQAQGRLSGTEFGNGVLMQTLKPSPVRVPYDTAEAVPFFISTCENLLPFTPCPINRDDLILCGQPLFKGINRLIR
jgi:hypothetical protein